MADAIERDLATLYKVAGVVKRQISLKLPEHLRQPISGELIRWQVVDAVPRQN